MTFVLWMLRIRSAMLALLTVCAGVLLLAGGGAAGGVGSAVGDPSTTPVPTWRAFLNGSPAQVSALVGSGSTLYLGGSFDYVGPFTGSFVAVDAASGQLDSTWLKVSGAVNASAADGSGGWFIGGSFSTCRWSPTPTGWPISSTDVYVSIRNWAPSNCTPGLANLVSALVGLRHLPCMSVEASPPSTARRSRNKIAAFDYRQQAR